MQMIPQNRSRLNEYQISISVEGDIKWKAYSGISQIIEGSVLIESDILFIGPKLCDAPGKSKRARCLPEAAKILRA
jgi:hypothetical protein